MTTQNVITQALKIEQSREVHLVEIYIPARARWAMSTAYVIGDMVFPRIDNGHSYICTVTGLSASSEPTWPTGHNGTVVDNAATWQENSLFYCDIEDADYTFGGETYTRNQIQLTEEGSQNTDGQFDTATLVISNVNKAIGEYLKTIDLRGGKINCIKTFDGLTDAADYITYWRYRIDQFGYNDNDHTARFSIKSFFSEIYNEFPVPVMDKTICPFVFDANGIDEIAARTCGFWSIYRKNYNGTPSSGQYTIGSEYPVADPPFTNASASTCDKGYRTPNGCVAHFNPADTTRPFVRFGGYPGMPTIPVEGIR